MQYLFAADRDNKRVAGRFDALSPAFLRALKVDRRCQLARPCPVALCGEIGGRPLEAMTLIAHWLPRPLDVGGLDRSDQGDDCLAAAGARPRRDRNAHR